MAIPRLLLPALVGAVMFAVYVRTMYPGLVGGDAAKFQFLGAVLGTAHPPGYPLFVVLSSPLAYVPIGTLAVRVNLLSIAFAVATVLLVYAILLRLGARPFVAASASLALAFDVVLWGRSLSAEVYSLNAALVALAIWQALRWHGSDRPRDLYLAVAVFALSLGNHLTAATIAPALALFVLLTRPATVTLRTVIVSTAIVVAGLAQYLFVMLRTLQNAAYVEARATNLTELKNVVLATRYEGDIMAFTTGQLLTERLPALSALVARELNPVGVALFVLGTAVACWRRQPGVLLSVGAMLGISTLTLNVAADTQGFMVAAIPMAWIAAGYGMQVIWNAAAADRSRAVVAMAVVALAVFPAWQLARNFRHNDHSRRTHEIRLFAAIFDRLESRTAIVREDHYTNMSVLYKLLGERAGGDRSISLINATPEAVQSAANDGRAVYAFPKAQRALDGLGLRFEPVQLFETADVNGKAEPQPLDMKLFRVFRLAERARCDLVGNLGWKDVTPLTADGAAVVRIDNYRPFDSTITVYTAGPVAPALLISRGKGTPATTITSFHQRVAADRTRLAAALGADQVPDASTLRDAPVVHRLLLAVNDEGDFAQSTLSLGAAGSPALLRATVDQNLPRRATVCGWSTPSLLTAEERQRLSLGPTADVLVGPGWRPPIVNETTSYRWMVGESADLALPVGRAGPGAIRVRLHAGARDYRPRELSIRVNGHAFPGHPFQHDWTTYEWTVPSDTFFRGVNRFTLAISGRVGRNVAVEWIELERLPE